MGTGEKCRCGGHGQLRRSWVDPGEIPRGLHNSGLHLIFFSQLSRGHSCSFHFTEEGTEAQGG